MRPKPSLGAAALPGIGGIHVPLGDALSQLFESGTASFNFKLGIDGADSLSLAPTAEDTEFSLKSNWLHPSFQGDWLPTRRVIDSTGFTANWSVSYLGRDYPQIWRESAGAPQNLLKAKFGVSLATPTDPYSMADRLTKYGALTFTLTFAVIWLTEILSGRRVHIVQYGFVGAALCLFGLLQLSLAEHIGFAPSFALAAAAVVAMVGLYSYSMLGSRLRAIGVGGVLGALYAYLYSILRAADDALLGGSLALFLGLAVAMYLTRRIDWHSLSRKA